MRVAPNIAFPILMVGLLLVYGEFLRPGRLLPGLLGSVMAVAGSYWLWRNSPVTSGMLLLILAAILLITETLWGTHFIAGLLGTLLLACGFFLLFPAERRIAPGMAIPISVVFGVITIFLAFEAKRGRRNKRSDL
jgi:membrane-bound serine protease (ClpP class)